MKFTDPLPIFVDTPVMVVW